MTLKEEFEKKFVRSEGNPDQDNYGERYIDEEPYKVWQWIEQQIKSACDKQKQICADEILDENDSILNKVVQSIRESVRYAPYPEGIVCA